MMANKQLFSYLQITKTKKSIAHSEQTNKKTVDLSRQGNKRDI
jgi:hypothetical protein